jgi:hypothetical protein
MSQPDLMALSVPEQTAQFRGDQQDVCPRCRHTAVTRCDAPDGSGAWFINTCSHCCFSWRSTENAIRVLETKEGTAYRLGDSEIEILPVPVPLPMTSA